MVKQCGNVGFLCRVRKKWVRLGLRHCWILFLLLIITLYNHLQLFERFHLHLKVVVGGREESERHHDNLSLNGYAKRDNIWIHIESRPEEENANTKNVLQTPKNLLGSSQSNEVQTSRSNMTEIRLVRKTESISEKKDENVEKVEKATTIKPTYDDYEVPGWPPQVSRNITHYIDLENKNSSMMRPKLGQILSKSRMAFSVVIAAQSAPANVKERTEVRSTWGENCNAEIWCRLIFVVGNVQNISMQEQLLNEQDTFNDILQEDFVDSYNNLTLKSVLTLKYYSNLKKDKLLLLKTDDDSYVHVAGLKSLIDSLFQNPIRPVLVGYLQKGIKKYKYLPLVHRPGLLSTSTLKRHKEWERWLVPTYMYPNQFFPQFLSGSGYIMSLRVAECLLHRSKDIPLLHLEDVFLTGLCAESCNVARKHHTGFKPRGLDKKKIKLLKYDVVIHRTTGLMDVLRKLEPATEVPSSSSVSRTVSANNTLILSKNSQDSSSNKSKPQL